MESSLTALPADLSTLLQPGKVIIFARTQCPYCTLAKEYLDEKEVAYEYIVCDKLGITDDHKEQLFKLTGAKTYPRIFVGTRSVGGFDNLRAADEKGDLDKWLEEEKIHFIKTT